ncbi:LysM peptidoglycan-binding domain-containing protein [Intrasporangium calvum]|uniref:Peptidoglycan-binding lysin domain n=1 Tax=Intrasporangium calvum (strain ATCC 23552 / DSM 43043 / JCM 3097 / NBRC 12989 / NCIMB 10167 / NRRL B-3866 / 7 KIP) TaxID=710696 RepID=E6S7P5_INTC7|nr:LysM peptidoglycan-binding domain-containing protein [Intrasporangium calvum]ADU47952.1 Peptidoglycan-binding lysin domain [Intrasporangium calvum DSM 43043]
MAAQVLEFLVPVEPAPVARPRLVLVPPVTEPTYRLTRRGRVVVAFFVALLVAALGLALAGQLASASGQPESVTVEAGQTLSEIALRELPQLPIAAGVVELQLANNLSTSYVHAGQTLVIPEL